MAVLEFLEANGKSLPSEIIEGLKIPKSSAYNLLDEMQRHGLLTQGSDGRYQLWMRLIVLGEGASNQLDIREHARRHLQRLMDETGMLCHLGIMDGNAAYYILKVESSSSIRVHSYEGKQLTLHRSSVGKCLLAWQPEDAVERLLPTLDYAPATPTSITSPAQLRQELTRIKAQGWSFDDSEDVENIRCVAAPVFGPRHMILAAISMVGTSQQITDDVLPGFVEKTKACAAAISAEFGCEP